VNVRKLLNFVYPEYVNQKLCESKTACTIFMDTNNFFLSLHRAFWYSHSRCTNRCTFIRTL